MDIIHLSDLHFGNDEPTFVYETAKETLIDFIRKMDDPILIISGDVTFKGKQRGFEEAKVFFSDIIKSTDLDPNKIVACPGNHDISIEDGAPGFNLFNGFIYSLRRDDEFDFKAKNFSSIIINDVFILVINSAFHLDHQYGMINEDVFRYLEQNKNTIKNCSYKIAITHHHLLTEFIDDVSVIRNSYPTLYALDKSEFNLILHGHQHANGNMTIGHNRMTIESARSFNFHQKGYNNGLNHYVIDGDSMEKRTYVFSRDDDPTKLTLKRMD